MNMTVVLALVAAVAAIFMLKRVLTYLLIRRAGRQALAEVGKRALTKLPEFVHLSRVESPAWTNAELVRQQAEPLLRCGFQDAGVYSVDRMPGVLIRMMCQPQAGVAAHIYDHPRAGSWIEMVTRYHDGSSHAVTTLPHSRAISSASASTSRFTSWARLSKSSARRIRLVRRQAGNASRAAATAWPASAALALGNAPITSSP